MKAQPQHDGSSAPRKAKAAASPAPVSRGAEVLDSVFEGFRRHDQERRRRQRAEFWAQVRATIRLGAIGVGLVILTWAAGALADASITQGAHWPSASSALLFLTENERQAVTQRILTTAIIRLGAMLTLAVWVVSALVLRDVKGDTCRRS